MLMSTLRDKIKVIILVTLLAFVGLIFFEWGMQSGTGGVGGPGGGGIVGTVNGREISFEDYRRTRQSIIANFEQRAGRSAEFADFDALEDETWLTVVQDALVQTAIEDYGIRVTNPEIMEVLRTNPPQFLRAHPDFLNEQGQFDPIRYNAALGNPQFNWIPVENVIRASLPSDKLSNYVGLAARVTSGEVRDRFLALNDKVTVRYVSTTPVSFEIDENDISEDDLRAYYDSHRDEFQVGQQAIVDYVRISKEPAAEDSSLVREDLEGLRDDVVSGRYTFEDIATTWSDDERTAENGGDMGFVAKGDLPTELDEAVFALDPGQVSEVIESPFGYHLLVVEEKKTEDDRELARVRQILQRVEASHTTLRNINDRIDDFVAAIGDGTDFETAAADLGLAVETTAPFERGQIIPGIGLSGAFHRFAFGVKPGTVSSDPIEDDRSFYALRLVNVQEPTTLEFGEVREDVRAAAANERKRDLAREKLAAAIASSDGTLESMAEQLDAVVDTTVSFARESFVPRVGRRNAFVAEAFRLSGDTVSELTESDRGFYVLQVIERTPADEASLVEQEENLRREILTQKRAGLITAWIEHLIATAEVVDYRNGSDGTKWSPDLNTMRYVSPAGV